MANITIFSFDTAIFFTAILLNCLFSICFAIGNHLSDAFRKVIVPTS